MPNSLDSKRQIGQRGEDRRRFAKYKAPAPQVFEDIPMLDLIQRYRGQAVQVGQALALAQTGTKMGNKIIYDQTKMGRYYSANRLLGETEVELLKRLGVVLGTAEVTNRASFIFLAQCRARGRCQYCTRTRTAKGAALEFWTTDRPPEPLPQVMAWNGASIEQIEAAIPLCKMLCRSCATEAGGKLLPSGKVNLKFYKVNVK